MPSDWIFELVWASALSTWVSGFGGLIHAAVDSVGGFGATPLKRSGWAMNAAASVTVRCAVSATALPSWMAAGGIKPIPPCRCSWLYHWKNCWQCARASSIEPKRSGKSGRYFRVLNCASEYGLSSETCGRLCVLVTCRSTSKAATGLERIRAPIGMQGEGSRKDVLLGHRIGDQLFSELSGFPVRDHPTDHVTAVDIEDDVQVIVGPFHRTPDFRDIPRPHFVGSDRQKFGLGIDRVDALTAALAGLIRSRQQPIHRADGAVILAFIEQRGEHRGRRHVQEAFAAQEAE